MRNKIVTILLITIALTSASYAQVWGNWENSADHWLSWHDSQKAIDDSSIMPSEYSYNSSWSTLGTESIGLTLNGWAQTLAIKLEYWTGGNADFLNNSKIEFDMAVPNLNDGSGWYNLEAITLNASGWGWNNLANSKTSFGFWQGSGMLVKHITYDYSAAKSLLTATATSGYIELILTTNNDSVHNVAYFDNFKLTPEPATMALMGLGGLALIRRKR